MARVKAVGINPIENFVTFFANARRTRIQEEIASAKTPEEAEKIRQKYATADASARSTFGDKDDTGGSNEEPYIMPRNRKFFP